MPANGRYFLLSVSVEVEREMVRHLNRLFWEEEGATAVEYALMVALIAAVIIAGATLLGTSTNTKFNFVAGKIDGAGPQ